MSGGSRYARRSQPRAVTFDLRHAWPAELQGRVHNRRRPTERGECRGGRRPCPWVSCKHHLYLDVNPETGSIKLNFPDLEVAEMKTTCALDVADRGATKHDVIAQLMNVSRARVGKVEELALARANRKARATGIDGPHETQREATEYGE